MTGTSNESSAADGRRHELGCPAVAGAPEFCTCDDENEPSAATVEPLYVSVRYVRLRRSYNAVHRTRDCRQLVKGARKIAELPAEWAAFLPACTACFPRGAWRMQTPAPSALFAWYMEAHRAA